MHKFISNFILRYFRYFAKLQLTKNKDATIIGVTGSAGKTSTRIALVQILKTHGIVKHSRLANSESGIPLNILGLSLTTYTTLDWLRLMLLAPIKYLTNDEHFKYYVVEMGVDSPDSPKNMGYLLSIVKPHVAIVLNANLAHASGFDQLVKDTSPLRRMEKLVTVIAKEKMQLAKGIYASGVAIINIDQKELVLERKDVTARQITFGKSDKANLKILSVSANNKGFSMSISYQGQLYNLALKDVFPEHYAYSFAAAIAAAAAVGIPPSIAIQNLASYRAPAGRMRLFEGIKGSTILDSTYNASPDTMLESLKLLKNLAGRSRKIAVIGDMRELGLSEKIAHKNLADWLTMYSDEVILYGDLTRTHTLPVLLSKKFNVKHFTHMPGLIKYLESIIKPKSHILLKGSQNTIYLERAVEAILNNQHDVELLCRRGPYWDKIRKQSK